MRLAFLFGLIGSAKASGDYFEPFPTCADCLPASVHDAPGIGFSLSLTSGTAAVHFYNGTVKNLAAIAANPEYAALMKRLANSPPPSPPSRWEKVRRSFNKKIGRPATPDVGIISTMLVSLRDVTSGAVASPLDRVAVSHSRIQGLAELDLWDALEYARIRPWVAAGLPRPRVVLPLPSAGGYPSRLLESYAVFAGHGKGLCKHYKNFWQCEEEQGNVPLETTLVVGITPTDLRGDIIRTWSAFTDLQPRRGDRTFVDLELGLATSEDKPDFWARVTERLQGFCGTVPQGFRLDTILLTGENATHPAFLQALRSALVGNGYLQRESDSREKPLIHEGVAVIDPVFASARGAAQYARWRQEVPIGCEEQDSLPGSMDVNGDGHDGLLIIYGGGAGDVAEAHHQ
ncbi:chitinase [Fusarium pseudoanthophilum]|uniref:Chitinase n=1 Tax=Fusarium pseudoanthophilum TaxID=48495 RepID=A0A8H5PAJ4_9HYPO|nr:chitinase [Fusarium pseudoanthophilum]